MHKIRLQNEAEQNRHRFSMDLWGKWMALYVNGYKRPEDEPATIEDFFPRNPVDETKESKISESEMEAKMKAVAEARKRK